MYQLIPSPLHSLTQAPSTATVKIQPNTQKTQKPQYLIPNYPTHPNSTVYRYFHQGIST
jgi:hypothetical protein